MKYTVPVNLHENHGLTVAYGEPMIFHCNHYNLFLQRTIEDAGEFVPAPEILTNGAAICVYALLQRLFWFNPDFTSPQQRLAVAASLYKQFGFGILPLTDLGSEGGSVITPVTHYSFGWREKWGQREKPVDYFTCGFIAAALAAAYGKTNGSYKVTQKRCLSMGDAENEFEAVMHSEVQALPVSQGVGVVMPVHPVLSGVATNVDEAAITAAVRGIPLTGGADGLIPAFGVFLTRHFANYYCYISYETARIITERTGEPELARDLFVEAGHVCAFNTFGGIMESDEWYGLIEPQCRTREDWACGIVAVANAFGWGHWKIRELDPANKLVIEATGDYESNAFLAGYGSSVHPRSYLLTGGTAGIMNLLYQGDICGKPALTEEYYSSLFQSDGAFLAEQKQGRTMGHDRARVISTRYTG